MTRAAILVLFLMAAMAVTRLAHGHDITVGFLVAEDADHVMIAATVSEDEYIAAQQIPRALIRAMDEIVPNPLFTVQ